MLFDMFGFKNEY